MLTLSDDKSAYGTLKGLIAALQEDIRDIQGYDVTQCQQPACHPSEATPMRAHLERTTPAPTRTHR
jgi:hypothetical protein